jgi:hypothetical protein
MAPVLKNYGYRNWWATEIRVDKEGTPYFIDPTARHPGQTGEHQWETCSNLAEIIWAGAHGDVIEPEFEFTFAAEATVHYEAMSDSKAIAQEWKTLEVPKEVERWFKPYHYCIVGETYHFVPTKKDEVGVILGVGKSIKEAIDHLKANLKLMSKLPVHANTSGFVDILESILDAEDKGIKFAKDIPDPKSIL